jgi:DNA-binding FadR family transcriptional regulator
MQPSYALAKSILFHARIYKALMDNDGKAAIAAMHMHLEGGAKYSKTSV